MLIDDKRLFYFLKYSGARWLRILAGWSTNAAERYNKVREEGKSAQFCCSVHLFKPICYVFLTNEC